MPQLLWGNNRQAERERLPTHSRTLRNLRLWDRLGAHSV